MFKYYSKLLNIISNNRFDYVVFSPSFNFISFVKDSIPIFIIQLIGLKYIIWIHGNGFKELYDRSNIILKIYIKYIFKNSYYIVPVSLKIVERNYNYFVTDNKIKVIHNGIENDAKPSIRYKNNGKITILFLSNMILSKGWKLLFDVAESICSKRNNVYFIFAGQITERESYVIKTFSKSLNRNRINYVGPKYGSEKEKIFTEADIFCFPTSYPLETFGIVNLEAMKHSLPIITTNVGGISEIVIDGKGGFVLNRIDFESLSEKIELLIENQSLRERMGNYNKERFINEFTLEKSVSKWVDLLKK